MTPLKLGYLLPTRERVMENHPEASPLMALSERAESLGYASVWAGDSLLARPRHEPLTLLAAVAGRTRRVELGTAVLLPALRNPVLLAHTVATLDQASQGRLILGVGIARDVPPIRAEFAAAGVPFDKRIGRMLEGLRLCRALWAGEPVNWEGRWNLTQGVLAPVPFRSGGPPIWIGGNSEGSRRQVAREFDGWLPNAPTPDAWAAQWAEIRDLASSAGRDPGAIEGAVYLTLSLDENRQRAEARLDAFASAYYGQPASVIRNRQACFAGEVRQAAEWIASYSAAGVRHVVLRFTGEHERCLEAIAKALIVA